MSRRAVMAVAALIAALAAVAPPAAPAAAGPELSEASGTAFPAKTFVLTLPERRALRPGDLNVSENGQDVDDLSIVPGDAAGAKTLGAMLVIDTSRSMRGAPIEAAMAAARQFAARRPAQQRLGVVFFNRAATVALPPTTDAAKIAAVLASPPPLGKGTRVYDAAALAVRALGHAGVTAGSLVVLSDGADVGSHLAPAVVASAARHAKTRVFTIGLRSRSYDGSTLRTLAASSGGRYAEADERQLSRLFAALGRRFGREYLIRYRSLSALSTSVEVTVRVAGMSGTASASYRSPGIPVLGESTRPSRPGFIGSSGSLALVAALAALLIGVVAFLVVRHGRRTVPMRIAQFTGGAGAPDDPAATLPVAPDVATTGRRRTPSRRWAAFAEDVDIAGLSMSPERIAAWTAGITSISVAAKLALGNPVFIVVAFAIPIVVRMVVSARANRTRQEFDGQLADNLQVVAAAMRAGQSFTGALAVAVQDAAEPARRELQRTVTDERLGVPLDEALRRTADRMRSEELEYVGLVATLQRDTGGNTAEVLDRVTETIRERAELKRLVRTLTAQGKFGGVIVSIVPLALAALFLVIRPGYFDPLVSNALGVAVIVLAAGMLAAGWIAIRKIVDIKV
jgi:tight adherence protein B